MIDINVPNVVTVSIIALLAIAAARALKRATGLPFPV